MTNSFAVTLRHQEEIAFGTKAFHFSKPAGFEFKPGQALDLVLGGSGVADAAGSRHTFSIVSAPFEDELAVATRMRNSVFKNALDALPAGSVASVEGPFGSLTLHRDANRPAVLVAGGIGITPFVSMLRQAARDRSPQRVVLLYSNRRESDAAFLGELQQLQRQHTAFRLVATMTQVNAEVDSWSGPTGPIDEALVRRLAGVMPAAVYYLAGPPTMVAALRQTLERSGIDSDDVRSEDFYGY